MNTIGHVRLPERVNQAEGHLRFCLCRLTGLESCSFERHSFLDSYIDAGMTRIQLPWNFGSKEMGLGMT